ncbi:hypothetical protein DXG01_008458 [Tephrocybe rancida]|nr:hypothetical protein DXG01_008458 [Tephrocybe rancida]
MPFAYQMQAPMAHPGPPVQQPIDHVAAQQVAPSPHPGYPTYQSQFPPPSRAQLHPAPQQQQPTTGNPYPSAPAPPPHAPWDQPHHTQPPHQHQPPPPPQHQPPPAHQPPPQHASQIQQPPHAMPQHQQPPLPPQHHHLHPQHPQPHQSQQTIAPPMPHHAHHTQPQPQPHQAPPQIQQPQIPYARTTAIVPIDTRNHYPIAEDRIPPSVRDSTMTELQQSMPDVCPPPEELSEMSQRAAEVVRLLDEYRRLNLPESERVKMGDTVAMTPPEDHRPPKRPWEDMSQEEASTLAESTTSFADQYPTPVDNKMQTTAEQDMEIIRTKRATSTAGVSGSGGQPKSKYRKRNYAKLQRKRDKQAGPNGEAPRIDMETLRASARAAEISDKSHTRTKNTSVRSQQSTSPLEVGKPLPQQHHQGSFQLVPMVVAQEPAPAPHPETPRTVPPPPPPQQQQPPTIAAAPTPPWSTSVQQQQQTSTIRAYAPEQLQHQSFMRTSHQATNHTPAR